MMTEGGRLVISHLFSQKAGPRHGLLATDGTRTGTHRLPDMLHGTVGLIGGGGESYSLLVPIFFPSLSPNAICSPAKAEARLSWERVMWNQWPNLQPPDARCTFSFKLGIEVKARHYIRFQFKYTFHVGINV